MFRIWNLLLAAMCLFFQVDRCVCVACDRNVAAVQLSSAERACEGCCGSESQASSRRACTCDGADCLSSGEPAAVPSAADSVLTVEFPADVPIVSAFVPPPAAPLPPSAAAEMRPPGPPVYLLFEVLLT